MTGAGRRALTLPADVSQFDWADAAAAWAEDELCPIEVWVNDAMTTVFASTHSPVSQAITLGAFSACRTPRWSTIQTEPSLPPWQTACSGHHQLGRLVWGRRPVLSRLMLDTPAHAAGAARGRAEIPGRACGYIFKSDWNLFTSHGRRPHTASWPPYDFAGDRIVSERKLLGHRRTPGPARLIRLGLGLRDRSHRADRCDPGRLPAGSQTGAWRPARRASMKGHRCT